jgi:DNA-binding PadR family transcriptional regulator
MKIKSIARLGLWEIAILALLREEPMHPYQMQLLLHERHKDELLALKRGSLYHAINRLLRSALIAMVSSSRHGRRPERTTYRIRPAGQLHLDLALREMISVPLREPNEFLASLSFLVFLPPSVAASKLERRARHLETEIRSAQAALKGLAARVSRIHLIESEYRVAMQNAELRWVRALVIELRASRLSWNLVKIFKEIRALRKASAPLVSRRAKKAAKK